MVLRRLKVTAGIVLTVIQLLLVLAFWSNNVPHFIYVAF